MCRRKKKKVERSEQELQDTVTAVGGFFRVLQREKELHEVVNQMGRLRFWSKDARARTSAE